jgi:uncharacterized protein (DUF342 family)
VAVIAKGSVQLLISPDETEAKLLFTPETDGLGWDVDAVFKLAREKNLSPLPPPADMEKFVSRAARFKTPMETLLVQGSAPEPALGESVSWETLAVPGDLAPFQEEVLAKAGAPALFRTRIEKIKRNTLVKKGGKFPFLGAREEVVAVWDKKEIREPVQVDPQTREIRYAERNRKLGILNPAKPGKPGKNVYARPVPPPLPPDPLFYLGAGIRKEKNELYAEYAGFIRIGENWADLVSLAKPSWEINLGSDGVTLFLNFYPGDSRFAPPKGEDILKEAEKKGAPEEALIGEAEISGALDRSMKKGETLQAFPLFRSRAGEARVEVSPDLLRAELVLYKGLAGGQPLEMGGIVQAIRSSKVQGFNPEELKKAIRSFLEGSEAALRYPLAEGKEATRGADKEVSLLAKPLDAEPRTTLIRRLEKALPDPRQGFPVTEAEQICVVEKGDKAAQISGQSQGEQGKDVYGSLIPGLPGNDPELKLFRGLRQQGDYICADMGGLLLIKGQGKVFWGTMLDYRDARITVTVSEDGMEASAELTCELGPGLPLTEEMVYRALAEAGVSRGINKEAVETACKLAALKGTAVQVLARGEMPAAAGGMEIRWLIPLKAGSRRGPGKIPVSAGTVLAEIFESAENRAGFDVRGRELKAEEGQGGVSWDDSVKVTESGGTKTLTAVRGGELSFDGRRLSIAGLKEIKGDVGPPGGNINFSGEVRITGKVHPGYTVMGARDVFIGGSADGALVSSGGKAVIVQGINGGGKGVVRARTTIDAAHAEGATLLAVEDIRVVSRCISCQVKTNGRVLLTGEDGRLEGGVCKARRGISAAELGNRGKGATEISFGQDYLIKDQIEAAEREMEKVRSGLGKIEEALKAAAGSPARLEAARAEKLRLLKLREKYSLTIFTLSEKFEEHHESEIAVKGLVHPGVVIESHGRYYEITEKRQGVVFFFDKETGRIMEKKL